MAADPAGEDDRLSWKDRVVAITIALVLIAIVLAIIRLTVAAVYG